MSNITNTCPECTYTMPCLNNDLMGYGIMFASAGTAYAIQKIAHKFLDIKENTNASGFLRAITFTAVILTAICLVPHVEFNAFSEGDLQKIVDLNNMYLYSGALIGYYSTKALVVISSVGAALGSIL